MIHPLPNIYICGDGFSHKQGWIEGALETAKEVCKHLTFN
jgi:monoamine oxidase